MRVAAIGDKSFTALWRLVGADALEASSAEDARRALEAALRSREYSAIIVPERMLDQVNEVRAALRVEEQVEPMIVVVPERGLGKRAEDLRRRISLAMGVEIRL